MSSLARNKTKQLFKSFIIIGPVVLFLLFGNLR